MIDPAGVDDDALARTLARATTAPFYRRRLRTWRAALQRGGLAALPLLDKETAAAAQEDLRVPGAPVDVGVVSSATTRAGRPLRVLRSSPSPSSSPSPRIHTLRVYSPRHGAQAAGDGELALAATLHDNTVDVLLDLLREHRPNELVLPLSTLKWVSVAIQQRGVVVRDLGLTVIGCTGYAVTRAARRWLEPLWGAPLVDNWSMSELEGWAQACRHCRHSHWHGAETAFELIGPGSGAVVDVARLRRGRAAFGELVATTLLPHGAAMPLVRYRTGDLVELGPPCRVHGGRRGMRFRGRRSHSLLQGDTLLAGSADLLELGEELADVAQVPHPAERLGLVPPSDIGVPKVRCTMDGGRPGVDVELRYDPARFERRAAEVRARFEDIVAAVVRVRLHPLGTLDVDRLARKL